jgi:hypothetical protein
METAKTPYEEYLRQSIIEERARLDSLYNQFAKSNPISRQFLKRKIQESIQNIDLLSKDLDKYMHGLSWLREPSKERDEKAEHLPKLEKEAAAAPAAAPKPAPGPAPATAQAPAAHRPTVGTPVGIRPKIGTPVGTPVGQKAPTQQAQPPPSQQPVQSSQAAQPAAPRPVVGTPVKRPVIGTPIGKPKAAETEKKEEGEETSTSSSS